MTALEITFWVAAGLIVYAHVGYPLLLWALARLFGRHQDAGAGAPAVAPAKRVALIIAAYDEQEVIERKVANALALDHPRDHLQVVVASDGSTDRIQSA